MIPKVSIIVPVYNCECYLDKCITSIMNQTLKEIEIWLIDDGSKDSSREICDKYAAKDQRINVIHQANKGAGIARNKGLISSNGQYIGFVDADDWIENDMFEKMYSFAKENSLDLVRCNTTIYEGQNVKTCWVPDIYEKIITQEEIKKTIIPMLIAPENEGKYNCRLLKGCVCCLFKRELIIDNKLQFRNIKNGQDAIFTMESMWYAKCMMLLKDAFYNYKKQESGSLSISIDKFRNYTQRNVSRKYIENLVENSSYLGIYESRWFQEDRRYIFLDIRIATVYNPELPFRKKIKMIHEVIYSKECKEAFTVPANGKMPFQLSVLYFLIKYKMTIPLYFAVKFKY